MIHSEIPLFRGKLSLLFSCAYAAIPNSILLPLFLFMYNSRIGQKGVSPRVGRNEDTELNIAIAEDQPEELRRIKGILQEYSSSRHLNLGISCFSSAEDLISGYRPMLYAVLFLDIYMGCMTGVEAAKQIRTMDSRALIVFLTGSTEFMPEAFSLHAFDYIEKPASPSRICRVMDDILLRNMPESTEPSLNFFQNRQDYYLPFSEIAAVSANGNYLEITDRNRNVYRPRMTFSSVQEMLSKDPRFLQILRGVLVNMDAVVLFDKTSCILEGDLRFPINVRHSRELVQVWQNYTFQKIRSESEKRRLV